ncbi:MAG: hypothetical protein JRN35_05925 [Nitrososphaerota archaeon]|nr:hypothetical protein [Nitrososphaerota archaeon]
MTLILALRFSNGVVLSSDRRVVTGFWMKADDENKTVRVNDKVALGAAGLTGAIDSVLENAMSQIGTRAPPLDEIVETFSELTFLWLDQNKKKLPAESQEGPTFVIASADAIYKVMGTGYTEKARRYAIEGSGRVFAEYIISKGYQDNMTEEEAKRLSVLTILETSRMDPAVGDKISMMVLPQGASVMDVSPGQVEDLITQVVPRNLSAQDHFSIVQSIVSRREILNDLSRRKFGTPLLRQHERAIFETMKPCHDGETFSLSMNALGLLIDEMDAVALKKELQKAGVSENEIKGLGSIGLLSKYFAVTDARLKDTIIEPLEQLRVLRSAHFPTHPTQGGFVDLVVKLVGRYPPNWRDLWLKALELYSSSIDALIRALQSGETATEIVLSSKN